MMEADAEWDDWKAEILQQLRQRAQQESIGCLTEPFTCRKPTRCMCILKFAEKESFRDNSYGIHVSDVSCSLDGHLQDQVESCNREITRLKYHNQELEQVLALLWAGLKIRCIIMAAFHVHVDTDG